MINCFVVDDEPLARECIENYIKQIDFLNCIGTCASALELHDIINTVKIDLLFLDIQMPLMNGLEFLKIIDNPPLTILTTAYPNYALEGFELNVLDYLLKPIAFNRFFAAVSKAKKIYNLQSNHTKNVETEEECFFIKSDGRYIKILLNDILFVQAMQNYVIIQTTKERYITLLYLKNVLSKLSSACFLRVHKSYIVSLSKIDSASSHELEI
uniref:LytR/AlgR family response regulator transcription factor n=1 Tax=Tenacibaculum agarivorans TaxID=1908389 RepID=UPI00094B9D67